ncbi:MAG: hypothetical protein ACREE6_15700 [Limisphaerales bacterium]
MQNAIEDIRQGIREIRHLLGPIDVKLGNLEHKIVANRVTSESKMSELDARISVNALRISEHAVKSQEHTGQIATLFERMKQLEGRLKLPKRAKNEHQD